MINATKMLLIQLTIVFPFLAILASAQSETYPDCCAALRAKGLSVCDFDFLGSTTATTAQTACVCSIDGIDTPLNQSVHAPHIKVSSFLSANLGRNRCITCIRATPELTGYADSYAAICSSYQTTATAMGDNSTSTTMTDSTSSSNSTTRTTTTRSSTTTTRVPTTASTTTHVAVASAVDNGNDAMGGNVPSIVLAALAVLAQIGL